MTRISSIRLVVHERDSRCFKAGVESKVVRFLKRGAGQGGRKETKASSSELNLHPNSVSL